MKGLQSIGSGFGKGLHMPIDEVWRILAFSLIAYFFSYIFLRDYFELGAAALVTFSLRDKMIALLERNRESIWDEQLSPYEANSELAGQFILLFSLILLVAFSCSMMAVSRGDILLDERYQNELLPLFFHNLSVLFGFFIFSLVYRDAGIMFILSWNAFHWASALSGIFLTFADHQFFLGGIFLLSITPHLTCEALAYVLSGMGGAFLAKGFLKHGVFSEKFHRVQRAVVVISLFALIFLMLAVFLEFSFAQWVYEKLTDNHSY